MPQEILEEIFLWYREVDELEDMPGWLASDGRLQPFPAMIQVSRVCRRWRQIVLGTPLFWTQWNLNWPQWTLWMLERSASLPLCAFYRPGETFFRDSHSRDQHFNGLQVSFEACSRHMSRIRELDLDIATGPGESMIKMLCHPARSLQRIHLTSRNDEISLMKNIFANQIPNLRVVELTDCFIAPNSPVFKSNLTELSLIRCTLKADPHDSSGQTVGPVLTKMTSLNTLHLRLISGAELLAAAPVEFSGLRFLTIVDRTRVVSILFPRLRFPSETNLTLKCLDHVFASQLAPLRKLCKPLASHCTAAEWQTVKLLVTITHFKCSGYYRDYGPSLPNDLRCWAVELGDLGAVFTVGGGFVHNVPVFAEVQVRLACAFGGASVRELVCDCTDETFVRTEQWRDIFRACAHVECLQVVATTGLDAIMNALVEGPCSINRKGSKNIPVMPSLRHLIVGSCEAPAEVYRALAPVLTSRKRHSLPPIAVYLHLPHEPCEFDLSVVGSKVIWSPPF